MKWGDEDHIREIEHSATTRGFLIGAIVVFTLSLFYILQAGIACGS